MARKRHRVGRSKGILSTLKRMARGLVRSKRKRK